MSTDINISNYEDYLYSYVDGELQAEEISALESFLELHPQFRSELDVLMATRLQPEAMVFDNKASLYRGSEVNLQNYESFLLSYIDGELNKEEKASFERFVSQQPKVQQELLVWQATKLQADSNIRFEDKSVLYRKAGRRIEIRPAYWWSAAAVVAGALFFLKLSDSTKDIEQSKPIVAVQQPAASVQQPEVKTQEPATQQTAPVETAAANVATAPKAIQKAAKKANETTEPLLTAVNKPVELTNVSTEKPAEQLDNKVIAAEISQQLKQIPGNEVAVNNRPSIEVTGSPATLATPAPAAEPPGELIMSVTGNGLESKVLDKVTNVARFFAKKRNK